MGTKSRSKSPQRTRRRVATTLHSDEPNLPPVPNARSAAPAKTVPSPSFAQLLAERLGLQDEPADHDGLWSGLNLPRDQYTFLWYTSWLSLISGVYALWRGHTDLAWVPLGVWLTSINYWRRPDFSWRRYVDITFVQVALWYQVYRAWGADHVLPYYIIKAVGMGCFAVGQVFRHSLNAVWCSTLFHGMVHALGNVANVVLYLGHVPPLSPDWADGLLAWGNLTDSASA